MTRSTAIIIFARAPQPGRVKTRLIPALGEQGALNLYRAMLIHALRIARECDPDELVLACTPDSDNVELKAMGQAVGATLRTQCGANLGARMHHALRMALRRHDVALLIGSDCPSLRSTNLQEARMQLAVGENAAASSARADRTELVFIPATDGGYVLVGTTRPCEEIFSDMPWGGSEVMKMTRERLRRAGRKWHEFPAHNDIDRAEDLKWLPAEFRTVSPIAPIF